MVSGDGQRRCGQFACQGAFRCCCNQRLLIGLLSSIADAPAGDRSTTAGVVAATVVVADAADPE